MTHGVRLDHIAVVLHEPRISENIGATARAMKNMGISRLIVVNPYMYKPERVRMMSTTSAGDVVDRMEFHDTLAEALKEFEYVVGTTARLGGQRIAHRPPGMARKILEISPENRVALVFGREDRGLSNEDLRLCHELVHIPTAEFSSLNLSQAVMILCYELFTSRIRTKPSFVPRMASRHELDGMLGDLKDILIRISYLNPENPDYWLGHLRNFFTRLQLRAREVSIIRGLIRQVNWYGGKCFRDGREAGLAEAAASGPSRETGADEKGNI